MLAESGNVRLACELAGVGIDCIYRLRRTEAGFIEAMAAARGEACGRLGNRPGVKGGPLPPFGRSPSPAKAGEDWDGLVIRRGIGGRLRLMAAGEHWWSARHDAIFLGHLRVTGNVAASARAAGFTPKSAWNRRERMSGFALAMDEALAEAGHRLENQWLAEILRGTGGMEWEAQEPAVEAAERTPFNVEQALRYLSYRQRKARRAERTAPCSRLFESGRGK